MWLQRRLVPLALVAAVGIGAAACGGDDDGGSSATGGKAISEEQGCAGCHGAEGEGGAGPPWEGLAGSTVELVDGTEVVADDEYLRRAIVDPDAEIVDGYSVTMPKRDLTAAQVDALVEYIKSLR